MEFGIDGQSTLVSASVRQGQRVGELARHADIVLDARALLIMVGRNFRRCARRHDIWIVLASSSGSSGDRTGWRGVHQSHGVRNVELVMKSDPPEGVEEQESLAPPPLQCYVRPLARASWGLLLVQQECVSGVSTGQ